MSCSCGDPFCDGYNCNNNSNGAFGLILIILLYPYLPFMIIGYELMDKFSNGVNIFKWLGAIIGFGLGFLFYFNIFRNFLEQTLNIRSSVYYWFICYILASFMFSFLKPIYPENKILNMILNFWDKFFIWALSVS
jgi:hypothetical protein